MRLCFQSVFLCSTIRIEYYNEVTVFLYENGAAFSEVKTYLTYGWVSATIRVPIESSHILFCNNKISMSCSENHVSPTHLFRQSSQAIKKLFNLQSCCTYVIPH